MRSREDGAELHDLDSAGRGREAPSMKKVNSKQRVREDGSTALYVTNHTRPNPVALHIQLASVTPDFFFSFFFLTNLDNS